MSPEIENAIRSVAKKCHREIRQAIDGKPPSERDRIITTLLDKYAKQIQCLPPNDFPAKRWLAYYISRIDKEQRGKL